MARGHPDMPGKDPERASILATLAGRRSGDGASRRYRGVRSGSDGRQLCSAVLMRSLASSAQALPCPVTVGAWTIEVGASAATFTVIVIGG
jgi:hypothetical protein